MQQSTLSVKLLGTTKKRLASSTSAQFCAGAGSLFLLFLTERFSYLSFSPLVAVGLSKRIKVAMKRSLVTALLEETKWRKRNEYLNY